MYSLMDSSPAVLVVIVFVSFIILELNKVFSKRDEYSTQKRTSPRRHLPRSDPEL